MNETKMSFSEFVLRYLDQWNLEARYLAEDLYVTHNSLNAWMYRGRIPNSESIKVIKNYFGEDFEGVVFDGKVFRRKFKIIRPDGSSQVYDTNTELSETEDIAKTTITRCCRDGEAVKKGKRRGCRFEWVYEEVEAE